MQRIPANAVLLNGAGRASPPPRLEASRTSARCRESKSDCCKRAGAFGVSHQLTRAQSRLNNRSAWLVSAETPIVQVYSVR